MVGPFFRRWFRKPATPRPRRPRRPKLRLEPLEERIVFDSGLAAALPPALVLGRTLSAYTTAGVQNNTLSITYTVYNEQADPVSGVLLTDALKPGVAFQGSSQAPDQNGAQLAWSLGTIAGYDRASVTLTVTLAAPVPTQLDVGAQAFATLDARAVSAATPAAVLSTRTIDPTLLASTPDANTTDPFVQEKAAELNYDPQQIFTYLHTQVGYNSYAGSVRGARGTLWSGAGNSLDVASLGVALMRASGIPAQYAQGTLPQGLAQQLIRSMFPPSDQQVGFVAAGAQTTDPANDPQLLAETEAHYWFQFDTGGGFQDADPLLAGAAIGQTFTSATGTFPEVADSLRETTEVQVVAEITSSGSALFGLGGQSDTTVLDHTFRDVELVGRPVTLGFNTSTSAGGFIFTQTTNTYSPYLAWGDDAYDSTHDQIIQGQDFQETQTNFAFASTALTGVFLNVIESGPQGPAETFSRTLFDRIGYAARQGLASTNVSVAAGSGPAFSNYDAFTLDVSAAAPDPHPTAELNQQLQANTAEVAALQQGSADQAATATPFIRGVNVGLSRGLGNNFLTLSQLHTSATASAAGVAAYFDRPRVVLVSQRLVPGSATTPSSLTSAIDILNDALRVEGAPGQALAVPYLFNTTRGMLENLTERDVVAALAPAGQAPQVDNTFDVFQAAAAQGIGFTDIAQANLGALDALNLPADARARITADVMNGFGVIVPDQSVMLNGAPTIAWAEINLATGEYIGVDANGGHQGAFEFLALVGEGLEMQVQVIKFFSPVAGIDTGAVLSLAFQLSAGVGDRKEAAAELAGQKKEAEEQYKELLENSELVANLLQLGEEESTAKFIDEELSGVIESLREALPVSENAFSEALDDTVMRLTGEDPPVTGFVSNPQPLATLPSNRAAGTDAVTSQLAPGAVQGTVQAASVAVSHQVSATWSSTATSAFQATALNAANATVVDKNNTQLTGTVALAAANAVPVAVSGSDQYSVSGTGSLSFYGPAETSLGVSGNWDSYSATVTGNVSLTLTSDQLTLNGQALPLGTYKITAASATLSGSGPSSSPNFAGSASINATAATVDLGPGSGNLSLGGQALDPTQGNTLTGYTGTITVTAGGGGNTDGVTLQGTAANVLQVSASPTTLTADQNTPVSFQAKVRSSLADTYNLTAQAPPGWTVALDSSGNVTVTPAPGLQGGTYPIQILAQSSTNPELVAQATVNVTVMPTQVGITLSVVPDAQFTVPFNGAQLPSAFQAIVHNNGSSADTFKVTFPSVPAGFTIVSSAPQVTIPAGGTGIVGVYLEPSGTQLPAVGTQAPFTVLAASTTNGAISAMQTEAFTVPAVDALTLTADASQVSASPGTSATVTITVSNVGNVSETVAPRLSAPAGITTPVFDPVILPAGQTMTFTVPLNVASTVPVNSTQPVQITLNYGPAATPLTASTQVSVLVRSAQTVAVSQAATDATLAGNTGLNSVLSELDDNFVQLLATPTDTATCGRAQFLLGKLSMLLSADPALAAFVTQLQALQAKASSCDGNGLLALAPAFFNSLSSTLAVEATQQFTVSVSPTPVDLMPGQSQNFSVQLTNTGNSPVSLTLSTPGLPQQATANFNQTQVTVAAGATMAVPLTLNQTFVSAKVFTLDVLAAASVVQHTATAAIAVRPAAADVLGVTVNPQTVLPGQSVTVGAQVFNTANAARDVLVHVDVLDSGNNVVASLPNVPATLQPGSDTLSLSLGQVATAGLVNGLYQLSVSLRATDGVRLPGQAAQAPFLLGVPVSATVTASATTLPPGNTTVTTTITVASQQGFAQAAVGDIQVMYNARNSFTDFPDYNKTGTINGEGVSPDAPVFVLENTSGVDITGAVLTITPPGGTADSFQVGTVPAGGRVFVEPGVSNDGGTNHTFFKVTGSPLDTSDSGPTSNSTQFELTGVQNGQRIDSGVFTPAATAGPTNDGKVSTLNFLGGPGDTDVPCNDCYGPKIVATLFNVGPSAPSSMAVVLLGGGAPTTPSGGGTPAPAPSGGGTSPTTPSGGGTFAGPNRGGSFQPFIMGDSVKWVGTTSGNWDDAANWLDTTTNTKHVPDATDEVTIDVPGVTVTVEAGNQAAHSLQVAAGSTLAIAGGNLTLNSPSEIDGSLTLSSGSLNLADALTLKGSTQWSGGGIDLDGHTLTNAGTLTITNSLALFANDFFTGANDGNLGGTLANTGTVVEQGNGSLNLYDSVAIDNQAGATFNFANDGSIGVGNDSPSVTNEGKIEKTGGTGISYITPAFSSTGTFEVDSGTLSLATRGGTLSTTAPLAVATGATLDLTGGSNNTILSGTFTGSGGGTVLLQNGSVIVGPAGVTFNFPAGMFQWTGGGINLDSHTLTNAGTLTLTNPVSVFANDFFTGSSHANLGGTLANTGTIAQQGAGALFLYDGVTLDNQAGATYLLGGDGGLAPGSYAPTVTNEGAIKKTGGTGTSYITPAFSSTGTFEVDSGTLSLATRGGTISTTAPLAVAAGATLDLTGGSNNTILSGTFTSSGGGTVLLANGTIVIGPSGATFNFPVGAFQWTGGGIDLDGNTLTNTGTLTLANAAGTADGLFANDQAGHANLGGKLVNTGAIVQGVGPLYLYDGVLVDNQAGGSYTLAGDGSIQSGSYSPTFTSEGAFRKSAGSGTSSVGVPFTNAGGTLEVDSGTLALPAGGSSTGTTFLVAANATLDLSNNAGPQSNILTGAFSASGGGSVLFRNGELVIGAAGATFNFPAGVFQWTGGGINLDGHTLTNAGTLTLANAQNVGIPLYARGDFDGSNTTNLGGTLANAGAIVQQGAGPLQLNDSVAIDNQSGGTYTLAGDGSITLNSFAPSFRNEGTFRKTAGSGTYSVGVPFKNTAPSLEVDSGTLSLPFGGSSAGTVFLVAQNATLDLSNGAGTQSNLLTGTFSATGGGTVLFRNGELVVGAAGATFNFPAGVFQWTGGGINLDGHTLTNAGTLTLDNPQNVGIPLYARGDFDGSNTTNLGGTLANAGAIVQLGAGPLQLNDSVTIHNQAGGTYTLAGDGSLTLNSFAPSFRNEGTVAKTAGSATTTLGVDLVNTGTVRAASGVLDLSGVVNNSGIIVADGANVTLTGPVSGLITAITNQLDTGTWSARGGATLSFPSGTNITENKATLTLDGAGSAIGGIANLAVNSGTLTLTNGATLTLPGNLQNNAGLTLGPGSTLTVQGNYTQASSATLDVQLGGAPAGGQFGTLAVTGSAALAGIFQAHLVNGYSPAAGDSFPVITFAGSAGNFSSLYLPQTPTATFQASVNPTNLTLSAQAAALTPTSLALTSSAPNGAPWGQSLTFTATVTPTGSGTGTPTGHVQFEVDGTAVGAPVPLTAGSASFTTGLTVGQHTVTAFYLSDNTTFANSDDAASPVSQLVTPGATPQISVQVGYADNLRANPFFPNPWQGSPDTAFVGNSSSTPGSDDTGAILIINNTAFPITVNDVTVTMPGGQRFDLWGSNVVPAGGNLILAQTNGYNFDTSDFGTLPFPQTYPDGETAHAAHIDITLNGVQLPTYLDTGHVLTTGGSDLATAGANESQNWRPIGTTGISNPGGAVESVTITHNLPASGYAVDPTTISPTPTSSSASQVVWNAQILAGANPSLFQLTGQVTNLAPGEVRQISTGTTVTATTTLSTGQQVTTTLPLAPVVVAGEHIIDLTPDSQTVERNAQATYTVELKNPLPTNVTYTLSLDGLSGVTPTLAASVPVAAGKTVDVPLKIGVPAGATVGTQIFDVLAQTAAGASDSVEGMLTVSADVAVPSLAVALTLTPAQVVVGQGGSATYTVAVTNVGDAADTYTLSGAFPAGFTGTFSPATIVVPPGLGNTRDVRLTLTPPAGAAAGNDTFSVTATSMTDATVQATADGTATVVANGVGVTLNPPSGPPGTSFQLTVTNTGSVPDTFDLALGGPAALVATLGSSKVTLAAGASQTVAVTTSAVNFADPGALPLTGIATSEANAAVKGNATSNLTIAGSKGLAADLSPASQLLPIPGTSDFLLEVHNTGNMQDSYIATIMGTNGPITASLINPETGQPTQATPVFKVPGLATGVVLLSTDLAHTGQGTVTVMVQSQSDPGLVASPTATANANAVVVVGSPGTVQFSAGSYSAPEEGGVATITLTRSGGSSGAVSVVVSTADGSGLAGQDYVPVSQTVTWADGDASPKAVTIPLVDDNLVEPNETVRLSLSSPTGGAALGGPSSAVLTIVEDQEPAAPPPKIVSGKVVEHTAPTVILAGSGFTKASVVVMRGHVKGKPFVIRLKTKFLGRTRVQARVPKFLPAALGGVSTVEEDNDLTFSVFTPGAGETASQRYTVLEAVRPGSAGTAREQAAVVAYEDQHNGQEVFLKQIPKSFLKQFFASFDKRPGG
jgi:uncharacterized membrane protein/transglutaminase-like putative cysteine protease